MSRNKKRGIKLFQNAIKDALDGLKLETIIQRHLDGETDEETIVEGKLFLICLSADSCPTAWGWAKLRNFPNLYDSLLRELAEDKQTIKSIIGDYAGREESIKNIEKMENLINKFY